MSDDAGNSVLTATNQTNTGVPRGANEQPAADWTDGFDDNLRGIVQTKGWKSPADAIGSYANLEKLMGADKAGRGVVIPKDDAPQEEWAQFYGKIGRPEKPEDYKLEVPEGDTGEFASAAAGKFHELNLTAKQAQGLAQWWQEYGGGMLQSQDEKFAQQAAIDMQDLKREWGSKLDANVELARRATREAGLSKDEAQAVERALGVKKAAQVFAFLGKQFAEAEVKGGEGVRSTGFGASPAEAKARIAALKNDAEWTAKYLSGNVDARDEFARLHTIAFSESQ